MRRLYTFFLYLMLPFFILRLYWKGIRLPNYRKRIGERFSIGSTALQKTNIWLHAVSLGEIVAATPLIEAMLGEGWRVTVTTMTPTGSTQLSARFGKRIQHQYVPYDYPWALRRFLKAIQPDVIAVMETELWPNMIHQAFVRHIPLMIINARISNHSFGAYQKARFFFASLLPKVHGVLAQSELDAERFITLGTPEAKVQMLGNIKFDNKPMVKSDGVHHRVKMSLGDARTVVIAASTHNDEEQQWLSRFQQLRASIPGVVLLIAPRHPERFSEVYALCTQSAFKTALRSELDSIDASTDIVVLDCMGELLGFYGISDYAFVGGSLMTLGGHNVLEPIAMQVPVFTGPHMQNSKSICDALLEVRAMQMASDADDLIQRIIALHQDTTEYAGQVARASAVLKKNQGTVQRYMDVLTKCVKGNAASL